MPQNDFFGDDSSPLASPTGSPSAASYLDDSFRDELLSPAPAQRTSEAAARASTSGRASSAAAYGGARSRGTRGDSPTLEDILGEAPAGKKERSIQTLMRAWTNETAAPELLHFPRELVERVVRDLARRRADVRRANALEGKEESWYVTVAIAATENMRAAHVLKSFTRERIYKIERFARFYLEDMEDARERLYHNEIAHAQGIIALEETYYNDSCISSMPEKVRKLDEPHMIPKPDLSAAVFVHVLKDCGPVLLPDGRLQLLYTGTRHMLRYSTIREVLRAGDVELI